MYSTNINNTKMEQGKYWMWTRRKQPSDYQPDLFSSPPLALRLPLRSSAIIDSRSWEEKAFAEDTAGVLGGGCIWPPRSYPCTFCERDFRSAQALGGHMNVHRRDRARMKQSLIVEEEEKEAEEELINLNPKPNFGSLEAVSDFGEEWRMDEMDFIRLKRDLDEQDDGMKGSCKKKKKKNSTSPRIVEELDLELRLGDLPKVK